MLLRLMNAGSTVKCILCFYASGMQYPYRSILATDDRLVGHTDKQPMFNHTRNGAQPRAQFFRTGNMLKPAISNIIPVIRNINPSSCLRRISTEQPSWASDRTVHSKANGTISTGAESAELSYGFRFIRYNHEPFTVKSRDLAEKRSAPPLIKRSWSSSSSAPSIVRSKRSI